MRPDAGSHIHVYWEAAAKVCIQGHAPTQMSNCNQRLCPCSPCVPIDMNGTACMWTHRTPQQLVQVKTVLCNSVCIGIPMWMRPKCTAYIPLFQNYSRWSCNSNALLLFSAGRSSMPQGKVLRLWCVTSFLCSITLCVLAEWFYWVKEMCHWLPRDNINIPWHTL